MKNIQSFKEKFGTSDVEINKDIINDVISDIGDEYNSVWFEVISWMNSIQIRINSSEKIDDFSKMLCQNW